MTEQSALASELLSRPSVDGLCFALRNPTVWPRGFEWDYSCCETCAMGLAQELWGLFHPASSLVGKAIGLPDGPAWEIFTEIRLTGWCPPAVRVVRPEHVAEALERWQRGGGQ